MTPTIAGLLGSYALIRVMVGALLAGAVGDILGRRKVMLMSYAWFSVGMAFTAMATTATAFGCLRFATGLGIGSLADTTAALVSEYAAPTGKKNLINLNLLAPMARTQFAQRPARADQRVSAPVASLPRAAC